jgi:hypothetical protein
VVEARADADAVLVVDAGDLLLPPPSHGPGAVEPDPGEIERRARLLASAFARMGTAAFTPGERDLAIGPALLRRVFAEAKVPIVSANLVDAHGKRLFAADRLIDAAGVKVGVFGVTRPLPEDAALWKSWGVEARDATAAAREAAADLRARGAQIVVALLHVGTGPDARKLLAEAPGIDWAVLGHSAMNLETPDEVGRAHMVEAMTQGKQIGRLDLHVVAGGLSFADRGQRAQLETILADHRRQLDDYRKRAGDPKQSASMKSFFSGRIADIEKAVGNETKLLASLPAAIQGSWFENRIVPLDASVPDQPSVAMPVAAYNRENERRAAAGKPVGVAARVPGAPPAAHATPAAAPAPAATAALTYAGTAACGDCHEEALKSWQRSKHAHALEALARVKRARDPTCVGCHVTGYMQPGGTSDIALATGRLREVGCEACHGPSLAHVSARDDAARRATTQRKVPARVCLGCHTPDQTNGDFDYGKFVEAVVGPGHGG